MIKTINADSPTELDQKVNAFEKQTVYPTGVSRVFATQTHVTVIANAETYRILYTAILFYKGDLNE